MPTVLNESLQEACFGTIARALRQKEMNDNQKTEFHNMMAKFDHGSMRFFDSLNPGEDAGKQGYHKVMGMSANFWGASCS